MAEEKKVQSVNEVVLRGTLIEKNLVVEEGAKCTIFNYNDKSKNLEDEICTVVKNNDFKNPSFVIECSPKDKEGNVLGTYQLDVELKGASFGIPNKAFDKDGKLTEENPKFEGAKTIIDKYITQKEAVVQTAKNKRVAEQANQDPSYKVQAGVDYVVVEPTRIELRNAKLVPNEYYSPKTNKYTVGIPKIEAGYVTSDNVGEEDACEGTISGMVGKVVPEIIKEEPSGRLKMDFYTFGFNGKTFPVPLVITEDKADIVEDDYTPNTCCTFNYDIKKVFVGRKVKQQENAFGGDRESKQIGGFDVLEFVPWGVTRPYEEDVDELFITSEEMSEAMEQRKVDMANAEKKAKEKGDSKPKTTKGAGANKADPFGGGGRKPAESTTDEEEKPKKASPF